ncbi:MAG: hypothetical protein ACI9FJ_000554 [Alteromonadaceae bacterium]
MKIIAVKPTKRLLGILTVPLLLALIQAMIQLADASLSLDWASTFISLLDNAWLFTLLMIVIIASWDYINGKKIQPLTFERSCKDILSVRRWSPVSLKITHGDKAFSRNKMDKRIKIRELSDSALQLSQTTLDVQLRIGQSTTLDYKVRPSQRGDASISGLEVLHSSTLQLFNVITRYNTLTRLKVYPDFEAINGYTLIATDNHVSQLGIRRTQRRGEGMEFHQLREYQRGDTSRQIDWKATARKQKIISRDYQDERDQQIIVMLDNGRRMRTTDNQLGHLDHAVNAMSLLSHIALKQGDAVGLMSFGRKQRWLPCKKGSAHINTILNHVYDLQPGAHATDYSAAAQKLVKMQRKRSLVILITNTRDEDIDDLLPAIKLISKHHLILLANIYEPILQQVLEHPIEQLNDVYRYCGTIEYLSRRDKVKLQLSDAGVFIVDTQPASLAIEVCNRYLDIKRSGYL